MLSGLFIIQGDSLLDLPPTLRPSSSHTSLNSADVRDFEQAEPIHMSAFAKSPSPAVSIDSQLHDSVDSAAAATSNISSAVKLSDDMTSALVGKLYTYPNQ